MPANNFKIRCTLPSGKVVYVNELTNKLFFDLQKYMMNEDLFGFYRELDKLIDVTSTELFNLSILDKIYIYISIVAYSVKNEIKFRGSTIETFNEEESYSLFDVLENMLDLKEKIFTKTLITKQGEVTVELRIPSQFEYVDNIFTFDPLSAIKKITIDSAVYNLQTAEDYKALEYIFSAENFCEITDFVIKNFNYTITIVEDKIKLPLLSNLSYRFIAESLYSSDLDYLLTTMYSFLKYLRMSINDFYNLSPIDSEIILLKLVKDKKEEREANEKNSQPQNNAFNL